MVYQDFLQAFPFPTKIVGGWVRNHLMKLHKTDLDFATVALPDEIMAWGNQFNTPMIPTGITHGTMTALWQGHSFEITTLRKDIETDGRHAKVIFTKNWEEDALRRDFTMNALYMNATGQIDDYVGGLSDLKNRRIRFVGDSHQRIREDYLRVWRYYRFLAFYGDIQYRLSLPLISYREGLKKLSKERIQKELLQWLIAPQSYIMYAKDLFSVQFDHTLDDSLEQFEQNQTSLEHADFFSTKAMLALFKIFLLFKGNIPDLAWSNLQKRYFQSLSRALQENNAQYVMTRFGYDIALSWSLLRHHPLDVLEIFPLKGGDLVGFCSSHEISQRLDHVLRWWCDHPIPRPSKEACLFFVLKC